MFARISHRTRRSVGGEHKTSLREALRNRGGAPAAALVTPAVSEAEDEPEKSGLEWLNLTAFAPKNLQSVIEKLRADHVPTVLRKAEPDAEEVATAVQQGRPDGASSESEEGIEIATPPPMLTVAGQRRGSANHVSGGSTPSKARKNSIRAALQARGGMQRPMGPATPAPTDPADSTEIAPREDEARSAPGPPVSPSAQSPLACSSPLPSVEEDQEAEATDHEVGAGVLVEPLNLGGLSEVCENQPPLSPATELAAEEAGESELPQPALEAAATEEALAGDQEVEAGVLAEPLNLGDLTEACETQPPPSPAVEPAAEEAREPEPPKCAEAAPVVEEAEEAEAPLAAAPVSEAAVHDGAVPAAAADVAPAAEVAPESSTGTGEDLAAATPAVEEVSSAPPPAESGDVALSRPAPEATEAAPGAAPAVASSQVSSNQTVQAPAAEAASGVASAQVPSSQAAEASAPTTPAAPAAKAAEPAPAARVLEAAPQPVPATKVVEAAKRVERAATDPWKLQHFNRPLPKLPAAVEKPLPWKADKPLVSRRHTLSALQEKEDAAAKELREAPKKLKEVREFWGKNAVGFAGPAIGSKSRLSKCEAQATLQRLIAAGGAVDFDEVRRLRKMIAELE